MTDEVNELTRRVISEESGFNQRLKWIREKLKMSLSDVSRSVEIPIASLHGWEDCVRPYSYENLLRLILYYNTHWLKRFENPPLYQGKPVEYINLNFIIIGKDPTIEDIKLLNERVNARLQKELRDLSIELAEKKMQLELFQVG